MNKGHDKGHKGQMSDRELMQQALEALNRSDYLGWQLNIPIIKALRERLAQPEQEFVSWGYRDKRGKIRLLEPYEARMDMFPLYTAPPKREWVGLTDEEMLSLIAYEPHPLANRTAIINAVERLLKEKNT